MVYNSECSKLSWVMMFSNHKMKVAISILKNIGWPRTWARGLSSASKVRLAPNCHRLAPKCHRKKRKAQRTTQYKKWRKLEARCERQARIGAARIHHWSCRWRRDPIHPWTAWAQTIKKLRIGCLSAWAHEHYWGRPLVCSLGWRWEISTISSIR